MLSMPELVDDHTVADCQNLLPKLFPDLTDTAEALASADPFVEEAAEVDTVVDPIAEFTLECKKICRYVY